MTKQAMDLEPNDIIELNGELEVVQYVWFDAEICNINVHKVHCLETYQTTPQQNITVAGVF